MSTLTAKPKKAEFVIKVEDRNTGERLNFDIVARTVQEAEAKAADAGWIVVDPSTPAPKPSESEIAAGMQERAVRNGILKALCIAAVVVVGLVVVGNIVVFLISQ
jgi:hypothetical protein